MCRGCYEEYGSPNIINAATEAAAKLIARVYEYSCVGGALHIAIDDWNLEDDNLDFCGGAIEEHLVEGHSDADRAEAERACLLALKMLTLDERAAALAIHDGYLG